MKSVSLITLTNTGYLGYTRNCINSLKICGFKGVLKCYCIDHDCHDVLKKEYEHSYLIDGIDERVPDFQVFHSNDWHKVMTKKYNIIYENLLDNEFVLFTDGDVVFENRIFLEYCRKNIADADLLAQNNTMDAHGDTLCAGFMFIRSNRKTLALYNPDSIDICEGSGDQPYINEIKTQLNYKKLPLELFPNGRYFYKHAGAIQPYAIHFNFLKGHKKKRQMRKSGKWSQGRRSV